MDSWLLGVHTPEFTFEQTLDNVCWATKDMRIDYPVALDDKYAVWRAFENEYWPALYLVDAQGHVRYNQFGEGNMQNQKGRFRHCWRSLEPAGSTMNWSRLTVLARKWPLTGRT